MEKYFLAQDGVQYPRIFRIHSKIIPFYSRNFSFITQEITSTLLKKFEGPYSSLSSSTYALWTRIETAWRDIPQEDIQGLFDSMPRRTETLIAAHGGFTPYWNQMLTDQAEKVSPLQAMKAHGVVDARVHIFTATALGWGRVASPTLGHLYPEEIPRYSFYWRLSGPQGQSGREGVKKNLHPSDTQDRTRAVQPAAKR